MPDRAEHVKRSGERVRYFERSPASSFRTRLRLFGEVVGELHDRAPVLRVLDPREGPHELMAVLGGDEVGDEGRLRRLGEALALLAGQPFEEEVDVDAEHLGDLDHPADADAVRALLVFLDLLERQPEFLAELLLAHADEHAARAHAGGASGRGASSTPSGPRGSEAVTRP